MAHAFLIGPRPPALRMLMCSKVSYPTRNEARRHMNGLSGGGRELKAIGSGTLGVYRCGRCAAWHVGHVKGRAER